MRAVLVFPVVIGLVGTVPALGQSAPGVSPTAPQAEDRPDVGDRADAPQAAPAKPVAAEASPGAPITDDSTKARYDALRDAVRTFEREAREAREAVRRVGERKYKERRAAIEDKYRAKLDPAVKAERIRRVEAVAAFEKFLERHPNEKEYTPDALFRLAELYFEKYEDDYQTAMREFKDAYTRWQEAGSLGDPPPEPKKTYERTVALYQRLVDEFPDYRLIDGAYYLLGFTQRAQGDVEKGIATWTTLVQRFPKSRFYAEVWFRVGDSHFENEDWDKAIAAFLNVVPVKDSYFYDKGLYKLAWTYYLVNRFDESVQRFFELLDWSAQRKDDPGAVGSVLEEEAIQYVAISFGDDKWVRPAFTKVLSGKTPDDPDYEAELDYVGSALAYFKNAADQNGGVHKAYERDVIARLGQNLLKQTKSVQAVAALEEAIRLDPLHRDAPQLQDLVVQAWLRERRLDKANAARDALVKNYSEGTAWAKRWGNDSEALRAADDFARKNLYLAALFYHGQGTQYFSDNKPELGVQFLKAASEAYKQYLTRYPHDKNAYELSFYLAETYFYSLRFDEAVAQYELTRDSPAGTKYRAESGLNAVYSYEKILEAAVQAGTLEARKIFAGKRDPEAKPEEIPELRTKYIKAIDKFLETGAEHEMAPAFGYRAGEIFYSYRQYDEGVRRFNRVVDMFPNTEAARFAANLILDDLIAKKDWVAAAQYAGRFEKDKVGGGDTGEFAKIKGGARFEIAKATLGDGERLIGEGKIEEANAKLEDGAEQYLALIAEDPKREFADKMLYNAALSLEKASRPLKAAALYERLYKEYPNSESAPEAMFRVATKNEQVFNFDRAIETYIALVKQYPKSTQAASAQINVGFALEGQQKYERAAQEFERYATAFSDKPEAADVFFRAALVHRKRAAPQAELDTLARFITRFDGRPAQASKVIEAWARIGEINDELSAKDPGRKKKAIEAWQQAVKEYARAPGSQAGAYFAARSAFSLSEQSFAQYAALTITSKTGKGQTKELETKSKRLGEVEAEIKSVITTYKVAEWSLAALYRLGSLYDNMQQVVLKSPCPDDVRRLAGEEACDEYRNLIEDNAAAVEEKAVTAYKTAFAKAEDLRIRNQWTRRTLEALNLLRPAEFPIDKEPLARPAGAAEHSLGPVLPDGGTGELKASGPGPAELAQKTGGGA